MRVLPFTLAGASAAVLLSLPAGAQVFISAPGQLPSGTQNSSSTENLDFADIDDDGDLDVIMADGGDDGNDRNRIWINQGGMQAGTIGFYVDETNARLPTGTDTSRDVDFVDIDGDGDQDVYVSNTSTQSNQSNRWWVNQGGVQAGTPGFFVDESSTRWVNIGVNDETTSSSVATSFVLPGGGFVDWSCDCIFADLDNDGDQDLVHTSYGAPFGGGFTGTVPTRLFLNDGAGSYEEFNPSDFQLAGQNIANGDPALWALGVHQHDTQMTNGSEADIAATPLGAEVGDLDGDWDIDLLIGAREEQPRLFRNHLEENGGVVLSRFQDITYVAFTDFVVQGGNYEQELGDFDNDNDLDIYGLNWLGFAATDVTMFNTGGFTFSGFTNMAGSSSDDNEPDFLDFDNDGDLDVYICNFQGQDRLYENNGAPNWDFANVTGGNVPSAPFETGLGGDSADIDLDGDYDVMVANDNNAANRLQLNQTNTADAVAPRVVVEAVTAPCARGGDYVIRAKVFSNASWDVSRYHVTQLVYSVDAGTAQVVNMAYSGGQSFRGLIPATTGAISYFARSTDEHGNTGTSSIVNFNAATSVNYCTAGTSASGCQALLSTTGGASATAASGFVASIDGVEGQKDGQFFFGANGRQAIGWGNGTSYRCIVPPTVRGGLLTASGTVGACDGSFAQDLNALWTAKPAKNPGAGATVQLQFWYRDPQNTSNQTTSFSDGVEFTVCP